MNSNSGGIYFLRAYRGSGQYEINAGVTPQDDAASGQDAADRMSKARDIDGTRSVTGEIGGFDEEDWYRMTIPAGHVLYLVVTQEIGGGTIQATVTDSAAREIWHSGDIAPGVSQPARLIMNSSSGGSYYLRIHAGSGAYQLETFIQSQNDGNSGTDAGDRMADALPIASVRAFSGELGGFDDQDWYALSPQAGNRIRFIVDSAASVMKLSFHNPERDEGWYAAEVAPGMSRSVQIPAQIAPPYYLKVHGAHGQYTLEIQ